ncbi:N-acetyltransferase [Psychromonas marina]|uniref:N-acetyltransferase n=1 Tax=Psychromonas marina TaxID=88364 RepID=A0ABQ6E5K0_9GAMM|nr:GNAT family N-acetyltransferase [Psychromonas marina]GLS92400.1 N-acetyltransferase [Psychromonas marina]
MQFIQCTHEQHASAILDIFNDAIMNSTALYDYQPRKIESMVEWFKVKQKNNFPVIGAVDEDGHLLGFASYGAFRPHPAYKYTVEHSVYINQLYRGRGLGRILLEKLIIAATEQQYHTMIGAIDIQNQGSIILHERLGFSHSGTIKHAAFKFGHWLDLGFYQLILPTPLNPVDG